MAERYSVGCGIDQYVEPDEETARKTKTHTRPNISALPIHSRRIVRPIKMFFENPSPPRQTEPFRRTTTPLTHKFSIRHNCRIKLDPECLRMVRITRTHQPVTWVLRDGVATSVPDRRLQYTLVLRGGVVLQKDVLGAPEAA